MNDSRSPWTSSRGPAKGMTSGDICVHSGERYTYEEQNQYLADEDKYAAHGVCFLIALAGGAIAFKNAKQLSLVNAT